MAKFSFIKNNGLVRLAVVVNAAKRPKPFYPSVSQFDADTANKEGLKTETANEKIRSKKYRDLDRPYAVMMGDPNYHLYDENQRGNALPLHYQAVHRTLDGFGPDEQNKIYSHELKKAVRNPDNGYEKVWLSEDQYAHDPELVKLAKQYPDRRGLEAYRYTKSNTRRSIVPNDGPRNKAKEELLATIELGKAQDRLRQIPGSNPTLNSTDFEPTDPLNIAKIRGKGAALLSMYTDQMPHLKQEKAGEGLCVCGRTQDKHTDATAAKNHFDAHGEHLEIHQFIPQSEGSPADDVQKRALQSPLLSIAKKDKNGSIFMDQPGIAMANIVRTRARNAGKTINRHLNYMPAVRIGTGAIRFSRITGREPLRGPDGSKVISYHQPNIQEDVLCPYCVMGKINPTQRDTKVHCPDCMPGKINMRTITDALGKIVRVPYTIGLGGGRQKYAFEKDVPKCTVCNGKGQLPSKLDETKVVDCNACGTTGIQPHMHGDDAMGFACGNCNSHDSTIATTPDNTCKNCDEGVLGKRTKKKGKKWKLAFTAETYQGNPRFLSFFNTAGHGSTGIDAWKAHGDKDCTRCHGDDEYQTNNGLPCNCRIASYDDDTHYHSPSNARYIFPNHIDIPEKIFQHAMANAYKSNPDANPHESVDMPHVIDEKTGLTPAEQYDGLNSRFEIMNGSHKVPVGAERFLGYWKTARKIPQEHLAAMQEQSEKHWSSRNAKYCAASADLDMIHNYMMNNFKSMPIEVPGRRKTVRSVRKNKSGRPDISTFHPNVQPVIPKIESTISRLGDNDPRRYAKPLDELYQLASHVIHDRKQNDRVESPHWDNFENAFNKVVSVVGKEHGKEKADEVFKAMSGLPKKKKIVPYEEPPVIQESTNA